MSLKKMPKDLNSFHTVIIIMWQVVKFVDRKEELAFLAKAFDSNRAEFIILYGRRRIGKTELIKEAIKNRKAIYFFAEEAIKEENLVNFRKAVADSTGHKYVEKSDMNWDELFEIIQKEDKLIVIFDEFPNLISDDRTLLSKFQKIWDASLKNSSIKLIFCGSSISMMENYLLDHESPLYGRRTGQILLRPLKAVNILEFMGMTAETAVKIYGMTDGIPEYIKEACYRLKNGEKFHELFQQNKPAFTEAEILIKNELREPSRYFMILKAIAFGNTKFGEIVDFTGFSAPTISKYLSNLANIHIIKESYPIFEDREHRRNRRYELSDNYFNFYFRFIYPNKSEIISTGTISVFDTEYNRYLGKIFEKVSKEIIIDKKLINLTKIGRWWHKGREIDLIAINNDTKNILFVECKWKNLTKKQAENILRELKEKSSHVDWNIGNRKELFGIAAKKIEGKEELKRKGYIAFDLDDF